MWKKCKGPHYDTKVHVGNDQENAQSEKTFGGFPLLKPRWEKTEVTSVINYTMKKKNKKKKTNKNNHASEGTERQTLLSSEY